MNIFGKCFHIIIFLLFIFFFNLLLVKLVKLVNKLEEKTQNDEAKCIQSIQKKVETCRPNFQGLRTPPQIIIKSISV